MTTLAFNGLSQIAVLANTSKNNLDNKKDRSSHRRWSIQKVVFKNSLIAQENTCAGVSFLIKLQSSGHVRATASLKNHFHVQHLTLMTDGSHDKYHVLTLSWRRYIETAYKYQSLRGDGQTHSGFELHFFSLLPKIVSFKKWNTSRL